MCADDLWLSGAQGRDTVGIHFTWQRRPAEVLPLLPVLDELFASRGGRPHWGKLFDAPTGTLPDRYPRFADFADLTRSATLPSPTDVTEQIYAAALGLYQGLGLDRPRIRRVGVRVQGLVPVEKACLQPTLIEPDPGWRAADQAVDAAIVRFGAGAVQRAVLTQRIARPPAPAWQPRIAPSG